MRLKLHAALVTALLTVGCGDLSLAGPPVTRITDGELTLFVQGNSPRPACVEKKIVAIAQAYRENRLPSIRARVNAAHPRFRAVADSDRAELLLADQTRLLIPVNDRIAAAVNSAGGHTLFELPASMSLKDCLE